jgi:hypothetical protein
MTLEMLVSWTNKEETQFPRKTRGMLEGMPFPGGPAKWTADRLPLQSTTRPTTG